jgi:hypothetical protein
MSIHHCNDGIFLFSVDNQPRFKVNQSAVKAHPEIVMEFVEVSPVFSRFWLFVHAGTTMLLNVPIQQAPKFFGRVCGKVDANPSMGLLFPDDVTPGFPVLQCVQIPPGALGVGERRH